MNRYQLKRSPFGDQGTPGVWALPVGVFPVIELPWDDNSPHYSCIPPGPGAGVIVYVCKLDATSKWSPRADGRLYHVMDVEGRSLIKIHAATWAGDVRKHYHSDLLGCIAPGMSRGLLAPPDTGQLQEAVLRSRAALTTIMNFLGDDDFELEVSWA